MHLDPKIVRAFIMGRFQDGTPVALQDIDGSTVTSTTLVFLLMTLMA